MNGGTPGLPPGVPRSLSFVQVGFDKSIAVQ